jgi:hypothetical protein
MTALALIVDEENGIVMGSDGAMILEDDGSLSGQCSKILAIPECDALLMSKGVGGFLPVLRDRLGYQMDGFDNLMNAIVPATIAALAVYSDQKHGNKISTTVVIGGWAEVRSRFEAYRVSSHDHRITNVLTGNVETVPPWTITPIAMVWSSHVLDDASKQRFGIHEELTSGNDYVARTICAARHMPGDDGRYSVGCFLQMSSLLRDRVFKTSIDHHWPDVLGEAIDPSRGEPLPEFLTQKDAPGGRLGARESRP